jgi:UDP-N-acetylmuramoyl-L-alanyl-D-glutamate--2,6-diaminopimelate ligase
MTLRVRLGLAGPQGRFGPLELPLHISLLGKEQAVDVALGATAALMAGARPEAIRRAAATAGQLRRRMEILRRSSPLILDDTTGNPKSLEGVFDFVNGVSVRGRLRVIFGLRGMRGTTINEGLATTLGRLVRRSGADLIVTASEDTADARNRVQDDERDVALRALRGTGAVFSYEATLVTAVRRMLARTAASDLLLLLGAQGMDHAAEIMRESFNAGNDRRVRPGLSQPHPG